VGDQLYVASNAGVSGTGPHLEELCTQLVRQQRDVLQDGQPHAPVLVLRQLLNGRQQRLRQQVHPNDLVHLQQRVHGEVHQYRDGAR
jgi:hypothetical protein